jgi:hypothetical protein
MIPSLLGLTMLTTMAYLLTMLRSLLRRKQGHDMGRWEGRSNTWYDFCLLEHVSKGTCMPNFANSIYCIVINLSTSCGCSNITLMNMINDQSAKTQLSDSKVRYITSLKRGDMGIRGKIH